MTMQNPQTCLSAELLRQLSHDELSPAELMDVEDHVSDCERCRQLLEVQQSDPQWQDEIVPILRTPLESPHVAGDHDERCSEGESLESILRLLGPTDDPHMLGRIGSYEVVGVIGRGGMGVVFKAYEGALNRFVAIKVLLPHLAASGAARKRFAREGQAAAAVLDDNVMPIYSVAEWQGMPYLVMQYSRGATLQKRIQDQGPLELKEILRIGMQTARGLAAAHAQGLVHRDVKPANILLADAVEHVKLTDFGLARAADDASLTKTGIIAGTPQYMSPEQARGEAVDQRSDLFSLGSVLYAMCTGRAPFRAETSYGVLRRITDEEPRPIREINPDIPEWLCRIVARLMSKPPDDRFPSALESAVLLEQCLAHVQQPTGVPLPAGLSLPPARPKSRKPKLIKGILTMTGIIGVAFAALFAVQSTTPPETSGNPKVVAMMNKLDSVTLPEFTFENVPLADILEYLRAESKKLDPDKTGVNIVLMDQENRSAITFKGTKLSLHKVLQLLGEMAKLSVAVEDDVVVLRMPREVSKTGCSTLENGNPKVAAMTKKLDSVTLPEFTFENVPLADILEHLRAESKKLDPDKTGVNIVLMDQENRSAITFKGTKLSLHKALQLLGEMAKLSVAVEDDVVVLRKPK